MFKSDDEDYGSVVGGAGRELEPVHESGRRGDFDNKIKYVDDESETESMVEVSDEGMKIPKVVIDDSPTEEVGNDDATENKIESEDKVSEKDVEIENVKCPKDTNVEKEISKMRFYRRRDVGREDSVDRESVSSQFSYENGDRNNNHVDRDGDDEKQRSSARWIETTAQIATESRKPDMKFESVTLVSGNASSSGVEGSSERSDSVDSDESPVNLSEAIAKIGVKVLPPVSRRYVSLSKRSGTSDSFSEKEGEMSSKGYLRPKERKKVLVKLLPVKQSSSDSASDEDILPSSDVSERKIRRVRREKRTSSDVTVVAADQDVDEFDEKSSSQSNLTSSESARGNISDSAVLDQKEKDAHTNLPESTAFLSKSQEILTEGAIKKKFSIKRNKIPLRQASYKIAVKHEDLPESPLKKVLTESSQTLTEMVNEFETNQQESKVATPVQKPLIRKISYEMAVTGGKISVSPSPPSVKKSLQESLESLQTIPKPKLDVVTTPVHPLKSLKLEPIYNKNLKKLPNILSIDKKELAQLAGDGKIEPKDESKLQVRGALKGPSVSHKDLLHQFDVSEPSSSSGTTSRSTSLTNTSTPPRFSNYEKILPLGGIITLIKGKKPLSETSGSVHSLSWDSISVKLSNKAQSLDSLPSTISNLSQHSRNSTSIMELIHVIKDIPNSTIKTWKAKFEDVISLPKSKSLQNLSVSPDKTKKDTDVEVTVDENIESLLEMKTVDITDTSEITCPYDRIMRAILNNEFPNINKKIKQKIQLSMARQTPCTARRFLVDGEVILLEDGLSVCSDCNLVSLQILWARQMIARLDDSHVYANIPPFSENLTVVRRLLAKNVKESNEDSKSLKKTFQSTSSSPRHLKTKRRILKRKGSRKSMRKFVKGAIEVIPELDEETDEEFILNTSHDKKLLLRPRVSALKAKGCKRRNLTRKAYAYDRKRMKKHRDKSETNSDDLSVPSTSTAMSPITSPTYSERLFEQKWNESGKKFGFFKTRKTKKLESRIDKAFQSNEAICSVPMISSGQSVSFDRESSVSREEWKTDSPLENYSVRFHTVASVPEYESPKRKKCFATTWWKGLKNSKSGELVKVERGYANLGTQFNFVPMSMNLIQHENGRLEIMYGDARQLPYTVGGYSKEQGRFLTLEEFLLQQYDCYQPPTDYYFTLVDWRSNLTSIKLRKKSSIVRPMAPKGKHDSPQYVFIPAEEPGDCPNKKYYSVKEFLQLLLLKGSTSRTIERGYLEKPRRTPLSHLPYRPAFRKPEPRLRVIQKPKKELPSSASDEDDKVTDIHIHNEEVIPELPPNVKDLPPGTYYYPYNGDDKRPSFFLKITLFEHAPPVVSFHCVEGHAALQHLVDNFLKEEQREKHVFKIYKSEKGVKVERYNLETSPPSLVTEANVSKRAKPDSSVNDSKDRSYTPIREIRSEDYDPNKCLFHQSDNVRTELCEGFKFPALRDSITHKPVERPKFDRETGTIFLYDEKPKQPEYMLHDQPLDPYICEHRTETLDYHRPSSRNIVSKSFESQQTASYRSEEKPVDVKMSEGSQNRGQFWSIPSTSTHSLFPPQTQTLREGFSKKPPNISTLKTLSSEHLHSHLPWSCPSSSTHSPTQLSVFEADTLFNVNTGMKTRRSSLGSIKYPRQQRLYEGTRQNIQLCPVTGHPHTHSAFEFTQHQLMPTREEGALPDWYLPRQSRINFSQNSLKSRFKATEISETSVDAQNLGRPVYANLPMLKEANRKNECTKASQGLLTLEGTLPQRRKSTGDTSIPDYENVSFPDVCDSIETFRPCSSQETYGASHPQFVQISEVDQRYHLPYSPTQAVSSERQQQISPSYYSLSQYPLTESWHPSEVCPSSSRHIDGTYSEKSHYPQLCPHSRIYTSASRHSVSSARHLPTGERPVVYPGHTFAGVSPVTRHYQDIIYTDRGYSGMHPASSKEYVGTDSEVEPYLVSSSSCPSTDTYHHLHTYPCTARHGLGKLALSEKVQLCRMKDPGVIQEQQTYRKKYMSRSSEFLDERKKRLKSRQRLRLQKRHTDTFIHSAEDIAERIAYHYLVDSDTYTGTSNQAMIKKKQEKNSKKYQGYISRSSEDVATRMAFHYVTEFDADNVDIGDSLMSSHTTISSPYHGRRSLVTPVVAELPRDSARTRSTPFLWCRSRNTEGQNQPEPVDRRSSPIWGKAKKTRTRTV